MQKKKTYVGSSGEVLRGTADFVDAYAAQDRQMQSEKEIFIAKLLEEGYDAATPNDGWVDRVNLKFHLPSYHYFNKGIKVGSRVFIGSSLFGGRAVIVTRIDDDRLFGLVDYYFEYETPLPECKDEGGVLGVIRGILKKIKNYIG